MSDDGHDQTLSPLYVVTFDIVGERQDDLWQDLARLASKAGIELKYRRSPAKNLEVVLQSDDRATVDGWAASVVGFAKCSLLDVTFLPVLRWRVLMRVPADQLDGYGDYIVSTYPNGEMEMLFNVEDTVPPELDAWYFRTADRFQLEDYFEQSGSSVSASVVSIEEFAETAEEIEAGAKIALHARLVEELFPVQEQTMAKVLGAIIQDHFDGQSWEDLVEEFSGQGILLMMGFPELLDVAASDKDPGAAIASHLIARCRTIVEKPTGPWVEFLARIPRTLA